MEQLNLCVGGWEGGSEGVSQIMHTHKHTHNNLTIASAEIATHDGSQSASIASVASAVWGSASRIGGARQNLERGVACM